jgi:ornithine decarboxylase
MNNIEISNEFCLNFINESFENVKNNEVEIIDPKMNVFDLVQYFMQSNILTEFDEPFFIVNLGHIIRQYQKWQTYLPKVQPYYAVKCNPDLLILKLLSKLGCFFDCASKNEISKILHLNISPHRIIFANPSKIISHIKFAKEYNVSLLTFDTSFELYKIKLNYPQANLLLRLKTDDRHSMCQFSSKFGVDIQEVKEICKIAYELDLNIIGISFHVGSGCSSTHTYIHAIENARKAFDIGIEQGFDMHLLDIGGGFPGVDTEKISFEEIALSINLTIKTYFYDFPNLEIIAEPGRFFVASSHTLILNVINKKKDENKIIYYVNDGIYGSLNNILMDHFKVDETNLIVLSKENGKKYQSIIFGPTCDSLDKITDNIFLPELSVGDCMIIPCMGAYSIYSSENNEGFNGFPKPKTKYIIN